MVNLVRRFKLEYNDASTGTTTIAELGQDTGALKIDRMVHMRRVDHPNILKVWLEGTNFGDSIPTRKSEFGNSQNTDDAGTALNEPEILLKQFDEDSSSFTTKGRFYARNTGTITKDGQLAVKLYSFMKYVATEQVNTGTITTDVEAALNSVLPQGYVADVPSGVTPPSVNGYSIDARREKGFQELTRDYKYALTFTSNLDSNNDYKVKYEPVGQGGTVDTLVSNEQSGKQPIIAVDTTNEIFTVNGDKTQELVVDQAIEVIGSTGNNGTYTISNLSYDGVNDETDITVNEDITNSTADGTIIPGGQAVFKSWQKDKTESIINKVTVEGVNPDDPAGSQKKTGTATNQTMINDFGEKFMRIKKGYVKTDAEAQNIAEKYLVPGLDDAGNDITKVPESGVVKTTVYTDDVVNDSFQVVDNLRSIDDTFTVVKQTNYWPEGTSELEFEFEQEGLEREARDKENLRDERARIFPSSSTDVGQQTAGTLGNDTAEADNTTSEFNASPFVGGNTGFQSRLVGYNFVQNGASLVDTGSVSTSTSVVSFGNNVEFIIINVNFSADAGTSGNVNVTITNTTTGTTFFNENFSIFHAPISRTATIIERGAFGGDTIEATVTNNTGTSGTFTVDLTVDSIEEHTHSGDTNGGTLETDVHNHSVTVTDQGHGGSADASTHVISGQTDSKNINVASEDKTDR